MKISHGMWAFSFLLVFSALGQAHGVRVESVPSAGVVFRYDEGSPAAFADVTVWGPAAGEEPYLRGTTDAAGTFAFCPSAQGRWKIRVDDGLGHAAETEIVVGPEGIAHAGHSVPDRLGRWLGGVGFIFGLAGIYSLAFSCRRPRRIPEGE